MEHISAEDAVLLMELYEYMVCYIVDDVLEKLLTKLGSVSIIKVIKWLVMICCQICFQS